MESMDAAELLLTGIVTVVKWLVYTGLLWGMIKVQKLNYNVPGLFASSLLATLVAMIPFAGGYLAYAVIVLCLWKCTGAEIVPDVVFTVCIAGALMFCFNLFAIGALMGKLRPDLTAGDRSGSLFAMADSFQDGSDTDDSDADADGSESNEAVTGRSSKAPKEVSSRFRFSSAPDHSLVLKGVTVNTHRASALVFDGKRTQTVFAREPFAAQLRDGRAKLVCEKITKDGVLLVTEHGQQILLRLKPAPGEEATQ